MSKSLMKSKSWQSGRVADKVVEWRIKWRIKWRIDFDIPLLNETQVYIAPLLMAGMSACFNHTPWMGLMILPV